MNTNVSIYKEPVLLDKGETKEICDCGGDVITRMTYLKDLKVRTDVIHCLFCTQDYYKIEDRKRKTAIKLFDPKNFINTCSYCKEIIKDTLLTNCVNCGAEFPSKVPV